MKPFVYKFGGAALADATAIRRALAIIENTREPLVVVVSAMHGVTDALLAAADAALAGDGTRAAALLAPLAQRHRATSRALLAGASRRAYEQMVTGEFNDCLAVLGGLAALRELTPRTRDLIVARGERLSAALVAAAIGRRARYVDATTFLHTDARFGDAVPQLPATDRAARLVLRPLLRRRLVPVVPGFLGKAPSGDVTTLGRGGTDLTAVVIARALSAREVSLWKDVPGLLTADPRVVPDARVLPHVHIREAAELAYHGAKVLHPRSMIPIAGRRIPVRVRPVLDPASAGTEVSTRRVAGRSPVRALAALRGQAMLTVEGNGILGLPGVAARTLSSLQELGLSIPLITAASSEHSLCIAVPAGDARAAQLRLQSVFADDIRRGEIDGVTIQPAIAIIAVVGLGMAGTKGVAARTFGALRDADVNVIAIAQGSSELNISIVVEDARAGDAQRAIHRAFQLDKIGGGAVGEPARTDLFLLGFGQIGRRVATMAPRVRQRGLALRVVGVCDTSGVLFDPAGISPQRLDALAHAKQRGVPIAKTRGALPMNATAAVAYAATHALHHPITVDVTADETVPALMAALRGGMDIVLANKRPMTGSAARADELLATARDRGRHLLAEATVGAGLPVLDTFSKLAESGDRVRKIEGCLSGTLGFLFDRMGRGARFSEAVAEAMQLGYTEPDPREDLSGMDVARKALTLGRLLGFRGELGSLAIESLVPARARTWPLPKFLKSLALFDEDWAARVAAARTKGRVLRYVAVVTARRVRVGLVAVDASSPFSSLIGTDNQVVFTSDRYRDRPLVVTGPGAGPDVTAAGVMNDILSLARRAR